MGSGGWCGSGPTGSAQRGDVAALESGTRYEKAHVAAAEQCAAYRTRIRGPHQHQDEYSVAKSVNEAAAIGGAHRGFEPVARHDASELFGLPGARYWHVAADRGDVPEGWLCGEIARELAQRGMNRAIDLARPRQRRPERTHDGDPLIPKMQGKRAASRGDCSAVCQHQPVLDVDQLKPKQALRVHRVLIYSQLVADAAVQGKNSRL